MKSIHFPPAVADDVVCALLDESMTATLRVCRITVNGGMDVSHNRCCAVDFPATDKDGLCAQFYDSNHFYKGRSKPPYQPGDILYVRETWAFRKCGDCYPCKTPLMRETPLIYKGMRGCFEYKAYRPDDRVTWHPSIHMPREAARIFLRVKNVRVAKLQDITVDDILAEGIDVEIPPICKQSIDPDFPTDKQRAQWKRMSEAQREEYVENMARHTYIGWRDYADRLFAAFMGWWNRFIRPADIDLYGWAANPWVWIVEFERISKEEALQMST